MTEVWLLIPLRQCSWWKYISEVVSFSLQGVKFGMPKYLNSQGSR